MELSGGNADPTCCTIDRASSTRPMRRSPDPPTWPPAGRAECDTDRHRGRPTATASVEALHTSTVHFRVAMRGGRGKQDAQLQTALAAETCSANLCSGHLGTGRPAVRRVNVRLGRHDQLHRDQRDRRVAEGVGDLGPHAPDRRDAATSPRRDLGHQHRRGGEDRSRRTGRARSGTAFAGVRHSEEIAAVPLETLRIEPERQRYRLKRRPAVIGDSKLVKPEN